MLLLILIGCTYCKNKSFIAERGIAFHELESDVIFESTSLERVFIMTIPLPQLDENFDFASSCFNSSQQNTTAYNLRLTNLIMNKFSHLLGRKEMPRRDARQVVSRNEEIDGIHQVKEEPTPYVFDISQYPENVLSSSVYKARLEITGIATIGLSEHWSSKATIMKDRIIEWQNYVKIDCSNDPVTLLATSETAANRVAIVFRSKLGEGQLTIPLLSINGSVTSSENDTLEKGKTPCSYATLYGSRGYYPLVVLECPTIERKNAVYMYGVTINTEMALNATKAVRISEILLLPLIKGRGKRQVMAALAVGGVISSLIGGIGLSSYYHNEEKRETAKLEHEVEMHQVERLDFEKTVSEFSHDIAVVNRKSEQLMQKSHTEFCEFATIQERIDIDSYLDDVAKNFENQVEDTLLATAVGLPQNEIRVIAAQLCKSRNKQISYAHCLSYYDNRNGYEVVSVYLREKANSVPEVAIRAKIVIPTLNWYEGVTPYSLTHVPLPLYKDKDNFYHFWKYGDLPKTFANFKLHGERKISLDNCKYRDRHFFCNLELLNQLYGNTASCLNSVMTTNTRCKHSTIVSTSNCIYSTQNDYILISHVGSINVQISGNHLENIIILDSPPIEQNYKSTNISMIVSSKQLRIKCSKSSFYYSSVGKEETTIIHLNATKSENQIYWAHDLMSMQEFSRSDEEIESYLGSISHITDQVVHDSLKFRKETNQDAIESKISKHLGTSNESTRSIIQITTVVISVVLLVAIVGIVIFGIKRRCSCGNKVFPRVSWNKKRGSIELESRAVE